MTAAVLIGPSGSSVQGGLTTFWEVLCLKLRPSIDIPTPTLGRELNKGNLFDLKGVHGSPRVSRGHGFPGRRIGG